MNHRHKPFYRLLLGVCLPILASVAAWPAAAKIQLERPYRMKLATVAPEGTPWSEAMDNLKTVVNRETDGMAVVLPFLSSTLGGELEILEGVQAGEIEFGAISTGALAVQIPELMALELPFLWNSTEECFYVLDNTIQPWLEEELDRRGLVFLSWSENGWQHFFSESKPILEPSDLKGMRVRSQQNQLHLQVWKTLGAVGIPLGMTEVLDALQRGPAGGGVEGTANTFVLTFATGWVDVFRHATISGHIYQPALIFGNKRFFKSLPEPLQELTRSESINAQNTTRKGLAELEPQLMETYKEMGREIHELPAENRARFIEKAKPVYQWYEQTYGRKMLDLIEKGKAEYAAAHPDEGAGKTDDPDDEDATHPDEE